MSYEGRIQFLCKNGHLGMCNCRDTPSCNCSTGIVWLNQIDDTNYYDEGIIKDWDHFLLTPEIKETCNLGHEHIIQEATYRIPTIEEEKNFRYWWDRRVCDLVRYDARKRK